MLFHSCHAFESFTVPSKVDMIGWFTFWDCPGLTELIMKPDVETYKKDPYWFRYSGLFLPME